MRRLRDLLRRALEGSEAAWKDIAWAYGMVHRAARLLKNEAGWSTRQVRARYRGLLGAMARHRHKAGTLGEAVDHFLKVTRSYWPGLFHCYQVADLPRTNNDLEHVFGSHRYHERRCSGRKTACAGTVLRGAVRVVSATATRLRAYEASELVPSRLEPWRALRRELEQRRQSRVQRTRFRRDPKAYLAELEDRALQRALPV